jgi:hypothetical protein
MNAIAPFLLAAALGSLGTTTATAQSAVPIPWPLGSPIPATIENNTTAPLSYTFCTPTVQDASGQLVVWGLCTAAIMLLPPGETVTSWWYQHDENGVQVPPGVYFVNGVPFDVGATDAALRPLGSPHGGSARSIALASPNDPNATYVLAASFSRTLGIPLGCGVHFPIDFDWLLVESLTNPIVFPNFVGALDADGRSQAPAVVLPPLPVLVGISFDLAFATIGGATPCGWSRASAPITVTVS